MIKQTKIVTDQVQNAVINIVQSKERDNLASAEKIKTTFGKIKKWFSDLRALAFKDKVSDIDIIDIDASKVNGLHTVATSGNYVELNNKPLVTKEAVGLANVANERQYSEQNKPPYPVTSVNGYVGKIIIVKADIELSQVADERQYSQENPPPYPVTSVQGRNGAVKINKLDIGLNNVDNVRQYSESNIPPYPVKSVNSKAGNVVLDKDDVGLTNVANERQYSEQNKPPYPVISVNGMTGKVVLPPNEVSANGTYPNMTVGDSNKLGGINATSYLSIPSGFAVPMKRLLFSGDVETNGNLTEICVVDGDLEGKIVEAELSIYGYRSVTSGGGSTLYPNCFRMDRTFFKGRLINTVNNPGLGIIRFSAVDTEDDKQVLCNIYLRCLFSERLITLGSIAGAIEHASAYSGGGLVKRASTGGLNSLVVHNIWEVTEEWK